MEIIKRIATTHKPIIATLHRLDLEYAYALMKMASELNIECYTSSAQIADLLDKIPQLPIEFNLLEDYVDFPSSHKKVAIDEVGKNLILASYSEIVELVKNISSSHGLTDNPVAIISEPEPEKEEASDYGVIANWLSRIGIQHYRIRVSGHYYPFEVKRIKEVLNPKRVIPIHTERPELTKRLWK